jgi:hypothetical protein
MASQPNVLGNCKVFCWLKYAIFVKINVFEIKNTNMMPRRIGDLEWKSLGGVNRHLVMKIGEVKVI